MEESKHAKTKQNEQHIHPKYRNQIKISKTNHKKQTQHPQQSPQTQNQTNPNLIKHHQSLPPHNPLTTQTSINYTTTTTHAH